MALGSSPADPADEAAAMAMAMQALVKRAEVTLVEVALALARVVTEVSTAMAVPQEDTLNRSPVERARCPCKLRWYFLRIIRFFVEAKSSIKRRL